MKTQVGGFLALLLGVAAFSSAAPAQDYPSRPVTLIVPFASGGAVDTMGRLIGDALTKATSQPFVVQSRPGVGGLTGMLEVVKAQKDGLTLGIGASGPLSISPILNKSLNFDPIRDTDPVIWFANSGMVLVARADLQANSVADLVALSKKSPGSVTMASSGAGSVLHLAGEYFQSVAGVKWTHVPYKGSTPALTDMLGGRVDVMTDSLPASAPHIRAGKLKALAVTMAERAPEFPDVPTLAEQGYKGFDVVIFYGMVAPKGTPPHVIKLLNSALNKALQDPEMKKRLAAIGFYPVGGTPEAFGQRIAKDLGRWGEVINNSKIEVR